MPSPEVIMENSQNALRSISKTEYSESFKNLKRRWLACVNSRGMYFENLQEE